MWMVELAGACFPRGASRGHPARIDATNVAGGQAKSVVCPGNSGGAGRLARTGWVRLGVVVGALVLGSLAMTAVNDLLHGFLPWIDRLAPKPGLSGLLLLALSPVIFLALASIVAWVLAGFAAREGPDAGGAR